MNLVEEKNNTSIIMEALKTNDEEQINKAVEQVINSVVAGIKEDYEDIVKQNDDRILSERGYRVLTSQEKAWYEKFIEGAKSSNPKQALTDLLTTDGGMPETIVEDVYRDLTQERPLLNKIKFQNVKYLTEWLLNDNPDDQAAWGEINSEITKQIESSFKTIKVTLGKLSAFAIIPLDMLDLGPTFLDNYIRTVLKEAMGNGLEYGIVKGAGMNGEPIGLIRDISENVTVSASEGYPSKTAVEVTSFDIKDYCDLIADNLLKKENGKIRKLSEVQLLVNPIDYVKKIVPATTVRNTSGEYVRNLFPFPTEPIETLALDEGQAIMCVLDEYFYGYGADKKDPTITYSDEFKFLEDKRAYKIKHHGFGRAYDNTSAILLDITNLDETYVTVKVKEEVSA